MPEPFADKAQRAAHVQWGVVRRRALVLSLLRYYLETTFAIGTPLPPAGVLASDLDLHEVDVSCALDALDVLGEIVHVGPGRGRSWRLAPGEQHPDDERFGRVVRAKVLGGQYRPGEALPATLLAYQHGPGQDLVNRAARHLVRDGLMVWRDGPAGHCLYVQPPPYGPHPNPTRPAS
ncbi:hypothetical protein ACIRQY_34555 [Streptomyces sp. NPDC101490]|uniref:hypothetical protein n=1 Tax=Streptomyces sp. NPDC101490 TaxID=3366143 RepID=UPI00380D4BB5